MQAQADACSWQQRLKEAEENYLAENIKIRTDLTARLERMTKQYEAANKDKESMVIKYATSEREVCIGKWEVEDAKISPPASPAKTSRLRN